MEAKHLKNGLLGTDKVGRFFADPTGRDWLRMTEREAWLRRQNRRKAGGRWFRKRRSDVTIKLPAAKWAARRKTTVAITASS